jgi:hypothetical protein
MPREYPLETAAAPTPYDRLRQVGVTVSEIFCLVGTLVGVGVLGKPVEESSGGALSADATLLAPAGPAFTIWTPVYLGLAGYTVWQWMPRQAAAARQRAVGWLAAASMVLNASWLLVTQAGWLWASVAVIVALLAVLAALVTRVHRLAAPASRASLVLVDATFGAYLGWVTIATCANIAATLAASGVDPGPPVDEIIAVLVIVVAAGVGVFLARELGGRWAITAAQCWGLVWIAAGRTTDEPRSLATAAAACAAACAIAAATAWSRRARSGFATRPAGGRGGDAARR